MEQKKLYNKNSNKVKNKPKEVVNGKTSSC